MAAAILTADQLREVLAYDPETGVFTWRGPTPIRMAGKQAGYATVWGYQLIGIRRKYFFGHRLAWLYMTGSWPANDIDHINGVRDDNRFANLRDVSRSVNLQNQRRARRGKHSEAPLGVWRVGNRWVSQINVGGEVKHLGSFGAPEAAHEAYLAAKRLFHPGNTL